MQYERIYQLAELPVVVNEIFPLISVYNVFLLTGDLGAGKTTFLKVLLNKFGIKDQVTSPTFSIVNEYETSDHTVAYHMDLYRLKDQEELIEIGIPDILDSNALCFIEWPELARDFLPPGIVHIHIEHNTPTDRKIRLKTNQ